MLEVILRVIGFSAYHFEKYDSHFIQPDSLLSYKYKSNLDVNVQTDNYTINIKTNSFGFRDEEWIFSEEGTDVLVLGDSFSAGFGLEKRQRWPDQLEIILNKNNSAYRIYNAAISGYSLEQATAAGDYLSPKIKPDIVIIGLFIYGLNRLENPFVYYQGYSIRKNKLNYARVHKDELYILHFQNRVLQAIELRLLKHSALYNFTIARLKSLKDKLSPPSHLNLNSVTDKAFTLLQDFNKELKTNNQMLIILPIIQHDEHFEFEPYILKAYHQIHAFSSENNIGFIDLLPELEQKTASGFNFWINGDPHWNESANRLAAEVTARHILKE